ncbi:MAG: hypothetical protein ABF306_00440 [Nocardioides marinisabuli]|uniref:hypothetical protein n=1 Tax=Nocardioides marinisabuli TaxID=419476 RepID=UPI00321951C5
MVTRHEFAFAPTYRLPALALGITPRTAWVELDDPEAAAQELRVRFGLWRLRTPVANITGVQRSGGFAYLKTVGPPHLSFSDKGVTFATNGEAAVCLELGTPVKGIDPTGRIVHPGVTLTVADPDRLAQELTAHPAR